MLGNTGPFPSPIRNRPRAVIIALVCISNKIIATNITACPEKNDLPVRIFYGK